MKQRRWIVIAIVIVAVILVSIAFYLPFGMLTINAQQDLARHARLQTEMANRAAEEAVRTAQDSGYTDESYLPYGMHDYDEFKVMLADGEHASFHLLLDVELDSKLIPFPNPDEQSARDEAIADELARHQDAIKAEIQRVAAQITSTQLLSDSGKSKLGSDIKQAINFIVGSDRLQVKQVVFAGLVVTQP